MLSQQPLATNVSQQILDDEAKLRNATQATLSKPPLSGTFGTGGFVSQPGFSQPQMPQYGTGGYVSQPGFNQPQNLPQPGFMGQNLPQQQLPPGSTVTRQIVEEVRSPVPEPQLQREQPLRSSSMSSPQVVEREIIREVATPQRMTTEAPLANPTAASVVVTEQAKRIFVEESPASISIKEPAQRILVEGVPQQISLRQLADEVLIEEAPTRILIRAEQHTCNIAECAPEVMVQQSAPLVEVAQAATNIRYVEKSPAITIQQRPPEIELFRPPPIVQVKEAARPTEVILHQEKPSVQVMRQKAVVELIQSEGPRIQWGQSPEPVIRITREEPVVRLSATSAPQVLVSREEVAPQVSYIRGGEPIIRMVGATALGGQQLVQERVVPTGTVVQERVSSVGPFPTSGQYHPMAIPQNTVSYTPGVDSVPRYSASTGYGVGGAPLRSNTLSTLDSTTTTSPLRSSSGTVLSSPAVGPMPSTTTTGLVAPMPSTHKEKKKKKFLI